MVTAQPQAPDTSASQPAAAPIETFTDRYLETQTVTAIELGEDGSAAVTGRTAGPRARLPSSLPVSRRAASTTWRLEVARSGGSAAGASPACGWTGSPISGWTPSTPRWSPGSTVGAGRSWLSIGRSG